MRKTQISKKHKATIVGGTVAALVMGGAAFAYWSTSGTGSGTAATSAGAADLTLTQTSTISNMYPGDSAQTISGTVKNNATNAAFVAKVTVSIASVTKATGAPAGTCDETDYTLASPDMTVGKDIASGTSENFTGATIKFNDKGATNQDACKGATVNLAYTAS